MDQEFCGSAGNKSELPTIFEGTKRLSFSMAELTVFSMIAVAVVLTGSWEDVIVLLLIAGVYCVFQRVSRGKERLCIGVDRLEYFSGFVQISIKWQCVDNLKVVGNRFVGKSIEVIGISEARFNSGKVSSRRKFVIPDVFEESLESIVTKIERVGESRGLSR